MYSRNIAFPQSKSFFLFGPRGTGKTTWLKHQFSGAVYIDLLESELFTLFLANPQRLEQFLPQDPQLWVIIDEVQRVPMLLHEVHRLIESRQQRFVLTGSNARKLKQKDVNLLAGRALTYRLYPLTAAELGKDFQLTHALQYGHLPATFDAPDPKRYLESYVATYLREEVQHEGFIRNIGAFARFLESLSFSQAQILNISHVAREASVHRKVVEGYMHVLEDLLIAERIPVFTKKAKRRVIAHPKFFFFDTGVYRTIRPTGPLDAPEVIDGVALESLVYQELKATNAYLHAGYTLFYWRTADQVEVDFILYGEQGLIAIEVKRASIIQPQHLKGLKTFQKDYPSTNAYLLYSGNRSMTIDGISVVPIRDFLLNLTEHLSRG